MPQPPPQRHVGFAANSDDGDRAAGIREGTHTTQSEYEHGHGHEQNTTSPYSVSSDSRFNPSAAGTASSSGRGHTTAVPLQLRHGSGIYPTTMSAVSAAAAEAESASHSSGQEYKQQQQQQQQQHLREQQQAERTTPPRRLSFSAENPRIAQKKRSPGLTLSADSSAEGKSSLGHEEAASAQPESVGRRLWNSLFSSTRRGKKPVRATAPSTGTSASTSATTSPLSQSTHGAFPRAQQRELSSEELLGVALARLRRVSSPAAVDVLSTVDESHQQQKRQKEIAHPPVFVVDDDEQDDQACKSGNGAEAADDILKPGSVVSAGTTAVENSIDDRVWFAPAVADYVRGSRLGSIDACVNVWLAVEDMVCTPQSHEANIVAQQHGMDAASPIGRSSVPVSSATQTGIGSSLSASRTTARTLTVSDVQEAGLSVVLGLIEGQYDTIREHPLRSILFGVLTQADIAPRWKTAMLSALTRNGRDISPFERQVGFFLCSWIRRAASLSVEQLPRIAKSAARLASDGADSQDSSSTRASGRSSGKLPSMTSVRRVLSSERLVNSDAPLVSTESLSLTQGPGSTVAELRDVLDLARDISKYNFALLSDELRNELVVEVARVNSIHTMMIIALDDPDRGMYKLLLREGIALLKSCLEYFDVVVRYDDVPRDAIPPLLAALCRTVNIEDLSAQSWGTMSNVLHSHYGHQGIVALCNILADPSRFSLDSASVETKQDFGQQQPQQQQPSRPRSATLTTSFPGHNASFEKRLETASTVNLTRGAVFFLASSSWGSRRTPHLHVPPAVVLRAMRSTCDPRAGSHTVHNGVVFEILLAVSRLVKKYGTELGPEWDFIVDIMQFALPVIVAAGPIFVRERPLPDVAFQRSESVAVESITDIRDVYEILLATSVSLADTGHFVGNQRALFALVESQPALLRMETVLKVMGFVFERHCMPYSSPTVCTNASCPRKLIGNHEHVHTWLEHLQGYFEAFFKPNNHVEARLKCLSDAKRVWMLVAHTTNFGKTDKANEAQPFIQAQLASVLVELLRTIYHDLHPGIRLQGLEIACDLALSLVGIVHTQTFEGALLDPVRGAQGAQHDMFCGFVDILERAVHATGAGSSATASSEEVANAAVSLLIGLFRKSFAQPPASLCVNIFQRLLKYVYLDNSDAQQSGIDDGQVNNTHFHARKLRVLDILCSLSVNDRYQLCLIGPAAQQTIREIALASSGAAPGGLTTVVSPYLRARNPPSNDSSTEHIFTALLPFGDLFNAFTFILQSESDPEVLCFVLRALQRFLLLRRPLLEISTSSIQKLSACVSKQATTRAFAVRAGARSQDAAFISRSVLLWFDVLCSLVGYVRSHLSTAQGRYIIGALASNLTLSVPRDMFDYSANSKQIVDILQAVQEEVSVRCLRGLAVAVFECAAEHVTQIILQICHERSLLFSTCSCTATSPRRESQNKEHRCGLDVAALEFLCAITQRRSIINSLQSASMDTDVYDHVLREVCIPCIAEFRERLNSSRMRSTAMLAYIAALQWISIVPVDYLVRPQEPRGLARCSRSALLVRLLDRLRSVDGEFALSACTMLSMLAFDGGATALRRSQGQAYIIRQSGMSANNVLLSVDGKTIVTLSTSSVAGKAQATVVLRRPSGVTKFSTTLLDYTNLSAGADWAKVLPQHVWMQIHAHSTGSASFDVHCLYDPSAAVLSAASADDQPAPVINASLARAIGVLDRTLPFETQKIGLLYDDGGGRDESDDILRFTSKDCSPRYLRFIQRIGNLRRVADLSASGAYTAGLEASEAKSSDSIDGEFAVVFSDACRQVVFHVATLLDADAEADPHYTSKKRHVGNDDVIIVWCEPPVIRDQHAHMSTRDSVDMHTKQVQKQQNRLQQLTSTALSGQFCNVVLAITPLSDPILPTNFADDCTSTSTRPPSSPRSSIPGYRIDVFRKPEYSSVRFGPISKSQVLSEAALAPAVRLTALNADVAVRATRDQRQYADLLQRTQKSDKNDKNEKTDKNEPVGVNAHAGFANVAQRMLAPPLTHVQERQRQIASICSRFAQNVGEDVFGHL